MNTQTADTFQISDCAIRAVRSMSDPDDVTTVWLDSPGKSVNTLTVAMFAELGEIVGRLERQMPVGVIFASAKARSFVAGADLFEIRALTRQQLEAFLATGQALFERIANLSMPTIAAINGDCLGGGLELALACKYRVATDEGTINIGLPEVKLGLVPGWGGTVRLPRLIGLPEALPLLLSGKTMPPARAKKAKIVDEIVQAGELRSAARKLIFQAGGRQIESKSTSDAASEVFAAAREQTVQSTGGNYPAPLRLIEVVKAGYERGVAAGLEAERTALVELRETDAAKNLMRLFFLRQGAKKAIAQQIRAKPAEVKSAAVLGGGTMGAGIVHALVRAGIRVRLIEVDVQSVASGRSRIGKLLDDDVIAGRMAAADRDFAFSRVAAGTQWSEMGDVDLVIEAVVERMTVKREIFSKLDAFVRCDCVLASNTSSLSITAMAQASARPNRVVGLHFFNPVTKMPLVEVVRTQFSDEQSLATAAGLAAKLGKTPVLVNDSPGFLVNRVLIPYLAEAMVMAAEGVSTVTIDEALKRWGMPVGPFELLDEIGLDVCDHIVKTLGQQMDGRLPPAPGLERAIEHGWLGKKSGKGFYLYGESRKKSRQPALNEVLAAMFVRRSGNTSESWATSNESLDSIAWRLVLPMANEAARLLQEGVVRSTDAIDLATVLGTGLAPFRGGLAHFMDAVGIDVIISRLTALAQTHGARFEPAPLLRELDAEHLPLAEFDRQKNVAGVRPKMN